VSFKLEKVVPWGRSLEEYIRMFNLTEGDLSCTILDCAGGPSSFNAQMTRSGYTVTSCDPIYQLSADEIQSRIQATYPIIIDGLKTNFDRFVWQEIPSPEQLGQQRLSTMNRFLEDFPQGLREGRYTPDELPHLSFSTAQFDIALCAHLLFSYSEQFSLEFHIASILELGRVAREVRIFPLLENFTGEPSRHLEPVQHQLIERGYRVQIERAAYEFQRNGNQLLRIQF
jgi:hypothetical protein